MTCVYMSVHSCIQRHILHRNMFKKFMLQKIQKSPFCCLGISKGKNICTLKWSYNIFRSNQKHVTCKKCKTFNLFCFRHDQYSTKYGQFSCFAPLYTTAAGSFLEKPETRNENHIFDKKRISLSQILYNVIYTDENIIVINKPTDMSVYGKHSGKENLISVDNSVLSEAPTDDLSFLDVMTQLRTHFNEPDLQVAISLNRFYSGLVVLARNGMVKKAVRRNIEQARQGKKFFQSYLAVTVGIPPGDWIEQFEVFLTKKMIGEKLLTVILDRSSKSQLSQGIVMKMRIRREILKANRKLGCALVKYDTNKDKWHSLEVSTTRQLCSILGDHMYSSRVQSVLGVPLLIEPHAADVGHQILPCNLKSQLFQGSECLSQQLPLHLHRARIDLSGLPHPPTAVSLQAPWPPFFSKTLQKLGLNYNFEIIFQSQLEESPN